MSGGISIDASGDVTIRAQGDVVAGDKKTIINFASRGPGEDASPYRFLARFEFADRDAFFGRDTEIATLVDRVQRQQVTIVVGASGSGKSSLIRAGLVPRICDDGGQFRLVQEYRGESDTWEHISGVRASGDDREGLDCLILDQFERVFLNLTADKQNRLLSKAHAWLAEMDTRRLLIIVREDFLGRTMLNAKRFIPDAAQRADIFAVVPLTPDQAVSAIVEPIKRCSARIGFAPDFVRAILVPQLTDESGGVTPTRLQIVCSELFEHARQRQTDGEVVAISAALCDELGGVSGILNDFLNKGVALAGKELASTLDCEPDAVVPRVRSFLKQFVHSDGTRRFVGKDSLDSDPRGDLLLEHLAGRHIIEIRDRGETPEVSIMHEVLCPHVLRWFADEELQIFAATETLERALTEYRANGTLLDDRQYSLVEQWLPDEQGKPEIQELMGRSLVAMRRRRRFRRLAFAAMLLAAALMPLALAMYLMATEARELAEDRLDLVRQELRERRMNRGRELAAIADSLLLKEPEVALLLAVEAVRATLDHDEGWSPTAEETLRAALRTGHGMLINPAAGDEWDYPTFTRVSDNGQWILTNGHGTAPLDDGFLLWRSPTSEDGYLPGWPRHEFESSLSDMPNWVEPGRATAFGLDYHVDFDDSDSISDGATFFHDCLLACRIEDDESAWGEYSLLLVLLGPEPSARILYPGEVAGVWSTHEGVAVLRYSESDDRYTLTRIEVDPDALRPGSIVRGWGHGIDSTGPSDMETTEPDHPAPDASTSSGTYIQWSALEATDYEIRVDPQLDGLEFYGYFLPEGSLSEGLYASHGSWLESDDYEAMQPAEDMQAPVELLFRQALEEGTTYRSQAERFAQPIESDLASNIMAAVEDRRINRDTVHLLDQSSCVAEARESRDLVVMTSESTDLMQLMPARFPHDIVPSSGRTGRSADDFLELEGVDLGVNFQFCYVTHRDGEVHLLTAVRLGRDWGWGQDQLRLLGPSDTLTSVAISDNRAWLLTAESDWTMRLWPLWITDPISSGRRPGDDVMTASSGRSFNTLVQERIFRKQWPIDHPLANHEPPNHVVEVHESEGFPLVSLVTHFGEQPVVALWNEAGKQIKEIELPFPQASMDRRIFRSAGSIWALLVPDYPNLGRAEGIESWMLYRISNDLKAVESLELGHEWRRPPYPTDLLKLQPGGDHILVLSKERGVKAVKYDLSASDPVSTGVRMHLDGASIVDISFTSSGTDILIESAGTGWTNDTILRELQALEMQDLLRRAESLASRNLHLNEWEQYFPGEPFRSTFTSLDSRSVDDGHGGWWPDEVRNPITPVMIEAERAPLPSVDD